ncbi:hypothetical protein [Rubritalea profundi]|uniref:Uncharacterized protein n=1 Tax=Rubritalea profundi TaxID=1658618 RepID=A0A2S7TZP5_9BACT|nr:hypothetical protein [Rubritalea profundi]PQJ27711.1 hypothetical protein BSZ32_03815 [Rubritalea profundi]
MNYFAVEGRLDVRGALHCYCLGVSGGYFIREFLLVYFIFVSIFSFAKKFGYICLQGLPNLFGTLVGDVLID